MAEDALRAFQITPAARVVVDASRGRELPRRAVRAIADVVLRLRAAARSLLEDDQVAEPVRQATRRRGEELARMGFYDRLRRAVEGVSQADPQIPLFELLPAFEEETGVQVPPARGRAGRVSTSARPRARACACSPNRLRALSRDKRLRRIGVVGCERGEGTTTVALGLARALWRSSRSERVLYLELDLKRPAADRELGLHAPAVGLTQFLDGQERGAGAAPSHGRLLGPVGRRGAAEAARSAGDRPAARGC